MQMPLNRALLYTIRSDLHQALAQI